jgi:hypothetical protein
VLDDGTDPEGVARLTLGLSGGGWILVRPHGYVAARGAPDGRVRQALLRLETSVGTRLRALPQ